MLPSPKDKTQRYAINKNIGDWQRKKFKKGIVTEAIELRKLNKDICSKVAVNRSTRS